MPFIHEEGRLRWYVNRRQSCQHFSRIFTIAGVGEIVFLNVHCVVVEVDVLLQVRVALPRVVVVIQIVADYALFKDTLLRHFRTHINYNTHLEFCLLTALQFQTASLLVHGVKLKSHGAAYGYHGPANDQQTLNLCFVVCAHAQGTCTTCLLLTSSCT